MVTVPVEPPRTAHGPIAWLRKNLFHSWLDTLLTVLVALVILLLLNNFFQWAITQAKWMVITDNFRVLMQGLYPVDQTWRTGLAVIFIMLLAGLTWGIWGRIFAGTAISLLIGTAILVVLPSVDSSVWGSNTLGNYLGRQLIPLFDVLRFPVLIMVVCLFVGYLVGRGLKRWNRQTATRTAWVLWLLSFPAILILIRGLGTPSFPTVPTNLWGGLLLTFMLAFVGIVACFPLGILLALGRMSGGTTAQRYLPLQKFWIINPLQWVVLGRHWWRGLGHYPIIKLFCVAYIEFLRGVPLITVFFTANLIVPLALGSTEIDAVIRAMVALTLFEAAYIAEIVRGGLQALPPGQLEAAKALGLNPLQSTLLITLPQALRIVIPALVGQFITMFKDTSLVAIVGLFDLLGVSQSIIAQKEYTGRQRETYVFVAIVFFVFSYGMSRAARQLERTGSGRLRRVQ